MSVLDSEIVKHRLPLNPDYPPAKQKHRRMKPKVSLKIKEEVQKQFEVSIQRPPMSGQHIRMCIDYRDLNRAGPKDDFPLPHIDVLVDNTTQRAYFSFMDGFSRYNQIKMALEDMEKTIFITLWRTFCYRIDLDKVRAIQEMPTPKMEKEVRGFLGRLNYIVKFISQLTATCIPIFKLLRKSQKTESNEECQETFEKIKQYLR
ncbi:hypothetical protein CR513_49556, partial [Mucuna pruriens]